MARIGVAYLTGDPLLSEGAAAVLGVLPTVGGLSISDIHDFAQDNPEVVELLKTSLDDKEMMDIAGDFVKNPNAEGIRDILKEHPELLELSVKIAQDPKIVETVNAIESDNPWIGELATDPKTQQVLFDTINEDPEFRKQLVDIYNNTK